VLNVGNSAIVKYHMVVAVNLAHFGSFAMPIKMFLKRYALLLVRLSQVLAEKSLTKTHQDWFDETNSDIYTQTSYTTQTKSISNMATRPKM